MKRTDLKKFELSDETIDEIMSMHGKAIESFKSEVETKSGELTSLSAQLEEAGKTIDSFKSMDVEAIKATAEEWKEKAEQAKTEAEETVKKLKFDHALEDSLKSAKARNTQSVKALLNLESIKVADDGKLEGLEEQLTEIKTTNDFLFEPDEPEPRIVTRSENKTVMGDKVVSSARRAAGLPS